MGSFNLDQYSWLGNNEIMLDVKDNQKIVEDFKGIFDKMKN